MIVSPVAVADRGDEIERASTIRWRSGEFTVTVTGARGVVDESDDATGFAAVALPVAMRLGEDLSVEGPVSPLFLDRSEEVQAVYAAWDPRVRPVAFHAPEGPVGAPSGVPAAVFSRGVDSMYTAARDRIGPGCLGALVFVQSIEPVHGPAVAAEEVRRSGLLAEQLGLPLLTVSTTVRRFIDELGWDWEDILAASFSCVAQGMAGAIESLRIASSDSYATLDQAGTHPLLDPLFSSERVAIEHDALTHTRVEKVERLARWRPDLLWGLKVCFKEDRADNCGRCGKCLLTMACLQVCGALDQASEFPDTIDLDAVGDLRLPHQRARQDWAEIAEVLGRSGRDGELRRVILQVLADSAVSMPAELGAPWVPIRWLRDHHLNATLSLAVDGVPYEPPPLPTSQ